MTDEIIHAFERAGLGKAPFRFIDVEMRWFVACPGAPKVPGSSCDYCGHGIAETCIIEDVTGKRFKVGNVCVGKTGDRGLINLAKEAINKIKREAKAIKDDARIAAAKFLYETTPSIRETLSTYPHPHEIMAGRGLRRADYVDWMLKNAGTSGQITAAKIIEEAAKTSATREAA